jgi:hypothetical protein
MDKFIKIQSNQSEFSNTANLVDFIIPQGDVYDLSDSWINLQLQVDIIEVAPGVGGVGVYDMSIQYTTNDTEKPFFFNSAIVRDCHAECSKKGLIESLRRIDILSQVRQTYEKGWGEAKADSYLNAAQIIDPINNQKYGISRQFNKEGLNKSIVNNNANVMIRLGDLMDFANTPEFDTNKAGQTRLHLRLNLDRLEGVQNMLTANIAPAEVKTFRKITALGVVNDITLGKDDASAYLRITDLEQVPYYVGMKCLLTAIHTDGGGDNKTDVPVVIAGITWDKDNAGRYTLTFEQAWGTPLVATKKYHSITLKPQAPIATSTINLSLAQLCLKRVANPRGIDQINYTTFSLDQGFGNSQQQFSDVFVVEPEATNILMTFQDGAEDLISKNAQLETYQVAVDNVPMTDRLVSKNSPLDYDRKSATFRRMGGGLRNLTENAGDTASNTWATAYADAKFASTIVASPIPVSDRQKQVQVQINGSAGGVGKYGLFKSLPRRLVF